MLNELDRAIIDETTFKQVFFSVKTAENDDFWQSEGMFDPLLVLIYNTTTQAAVNISENDSPGWVWANLMYLWNKTSKRSKKCIFGHFQTLPTSVIRWCVNFYSISKLFSAKLPRWLAFNNPLIIWPSHYNWKLVFDPELHQINYNPGLQYNKCAFKFI